MRLLILIATLALSLFSFTLQAAERPNIVWILSEDNSIHYLEHFFPGGAKAPHIEALAAHGLTYNHAFSNAPVCSVARTTLATGCYGPRIGTQFHRKYRTVPMPEGLKMFPAYLRAAGYYTTNNSKTDYNAIASNDVWNESSKSAGWRNRKEKSQPFFHMESHGQSHESSLHFNQKTYENEKTKTDPASVKLAPYFPDTKLFRYTHARYHDRVMAIDEIVGNTVKKLKEDGLLEDTFVFYFGDHGGVLPRGKGYIYESGLHVPLVVRVPKNFQHLVDAKNGTRIDGFVSFVDFGPTALNLAGVKTPEQMDGRPFLGKGISTDELNTRDESFGYADRFDEKYDLLRSLRKGKYQYIRCYQPQLPDGLQNNYRYKMLAYKEWRELFQAGKLSGPPLAFFEPKPVELLFDCEADPHQIHNLAEDLKYVKVLHELRHLLQEKVKNLPDLSFIPESELVGKPFENPVKYGRQHRQEIQELIRTADLALLPFAQAKPRLLTSLKSENPRERYWSAMVCTSFGKEATGLAEEVSALLNDDSEFVRMRAAEFLGLIGVINPQPILTELVNTTKNPVLATEALNSVVWFRDFFADRFPVKRSDFHPVSKGADVDDRLNYLNGIPYPQKKQNTKKKKP